MCVIIFGRGVVAFPKVSNAAPCVDLDADPPTLRVERSLRRSSSGMILSPPKTPPAGGWCHSPRSAVCQSRPVGASAEASRYRNSGPTRQRQSVAVIDLLPARYPAVGCCVGAGTPPPRVERSGRIWRRPDALCSPVVTRSLALLLAPLLRRFIAPESSTDQVRDELRGDDLVGYLFWACATWFAVVGLTAGSSLPFVVLGSTWPVFDVLSRVLLATSVLALLPFLGYLGAYAWHRRREGTRTP
jgi:hypothetical protein